MAFGGHIRGEIRSGEVLSVDLTGAPFHKQAIGQTAEEAQHEHTIGMTHPAAVIILRDVQALVQPVFDAAEAGAIDLQPSPGIEPLRRSAGQQRHRLGFAARGLAMDSGELGGCREANRFRGGGGRTENARFLPAAIALLRAGPRARGVLRGGRLPEGAAAAFLWFGEGWVDCL